MAAGDWAELKIDSRLPEDSGGSSKSNATVSLGFLRSYEHMGAAKVECVANCRCDVSTGPGRRVVMAAMCRHHLWLNGGVTTPTLLLPCCSSL